MGHSACRAVAREFLGPVTPSRDLIALGPGFRQEGLIQLVFAVEPLGKRLGGSASGAGSCGCRAGGVPSVRRCWIFRLGAMVATIMIFGGAVAAPSRAAECPIGGGHCYSYGYAFPPASYGAYAYDCVNAMSVGNTSTDFVNQEMWVGTDTSQNYWTEAGVTLGATQNGSTGVPEFFWADNNAKYNYHEHDDTTDSVSYGPHYHEQISWSSGGNGSYWWYVTVGPFTPSGAPSWQNTPYAGGNNGDLEAGMEFTNTSDVDSGSVSGLHWLDTSWNWHQYWPSYSQEVDSPSAGYWNIGGLYWRDALNTGYSC